MPLPRTIAGDPDGGAPWSILSNEFAVVHLILDHQANGTRLVVFDPSSGRHIALDPLELQALAWSRHEQLAALLAPSFKESYLVDVDPTLLAAGEAVPNDISFDFDEGPQLDA